MKIIISKFYGNPCNALLSLLYPFRRSLHFPLYHILVKCFPRHLLKPCTKITPAHPYPFCHVFRAKILPDMSIHILDNRCKSTDIIFL